MSPQPACVVFAGGGTLGHLFPGLAVAEEVRRERPDWQIVFAGGGKPWESEQVLRRGYGYLQTPCRPWPGRRWAAGKFLFDNALGYCAALRFLRRRRVAAVVGLGGFASAPAARAAATCGIPVVLLEQNALPGKVNRWLAPYASLVCAAFEESRPFLRISGAFVLTGNPIRREAAAGAACEVRERRILVVGGSRGSKSLNQQVPQALAQTKLSEQGWRILHLAGEQGLAETQAHYQSLGVPATVQPFIENLPQALACSRLAICRAGGSTLAELALAGTPAVVCPYPQAADDHQRRNAASFAAAGACLVVDEQLPGETFSERLAGAASLMTNDEEVWSRFAAAMRSLARGDAARRVAELILERAEQRRCA